jgi:hypothetical protein
MILCVHLPPDLLAELADCDDGQRRAVALAVCELAVQRSGLAGELIGPALDALRRGHGGPLLTAEVEALTGRLDDAAWEIQDAGDEAGYLAAFAKARAAGALGFALVDATDDALYEALHAIGDEPAVLRAARMALPAPPKPPTAGPG